MSILRERWKKSQAERVVRERKNLIKDEKLGVAKELRKLEDGQHDDTDIENILKNISVLESEDAREILRNFDNAKVFEELIKKDPTWVKENILIFSDLDHHALHALIETGEKEAIKEGVEKNVFDITEINERIVDNIEGSFTMFEKEGEYDYKKAVDTLKKSGITKIFEGDSIQFPAKTFSIVLKQGNADWIKDNQNLFNIEEIKETIDNKDTLKDVFQIDDDYTYTDIFKDLIKAGFEEEAPHILDKADEGSLTEEVLQNIIEGDKEEEKRENIEAVMHNKDRFNIKKDEDFTNTVVMASLESDISAEVIADNLSNLPELNEDTLDALLKKSKAEDSEVADRCLEKIIDSMSNINIESNTLVNKLIKEGFVGNIAKNLEKFSNLDRKVFTALLATEGALGEILNRKDGLHEIFKKDILEKAIRKIYAKAAHNLKEIEADSVRERVDSALHEGNEDIPNSLELTDEDDIKKVRDYLEAKKLVSSITKEKVEKIKEQVKNPDDSEVAERAAEVVQEIKEEVTEEQARVEENIPQEVPEKTRNNTVKNWKRKGLGRYIKTIMKSLLPRDKGIFGRKPESIAVEAYTKIQNLYENIEETENNANDQEVLSFKKDFEEILEAMNKIKNRKEVKRIENSEEYKQAIEAYQKIVHKEIKKSKKAEEDQLKENTPENTTRRTVRNNWKAVVKNIGNIKKGETSA